MAGILDNLMSYLPQGILNAPDYLTLNPATGQTDATADPVANDPYAMLDRKQREDAAKKADLGPFDGGVLPPAPVAPGISGQQAMNIGPFGSLSPVMPQQPVAPTPVADANASGPVPMPRPRPVMSTPSAPSAPMDITPKVANANAADVPNAPVPQSSLLGRIGEALQTADAKISPHTATLLALAGGLAGAPSWGTGIGRGMTAAAAALPMDQRLAMQNMGIAQTYRALREAQVPPQLALASVYNPELLKSTLQNYVTDRQWKPITLNDGFGGQRVVAFNPFTQETKDITAAGDGSPGSASPNIQSVMDNITQKRAAGASPQELLQEVPSAQRDYVSALLSGNALPSNMGRSVDRAAVMKLAHAVDPTFDETMIPTRVQMRKDFAGEGKNGMAIGAFNTVQHHAGQVSDAIDEFEKAGGGTNYPIINAGKLMLANNTSFDPQLRDSAQKLKDKLNATEHEVASAYNSGHLSDRDLAMWNEIKSQNLPINQLRQKLADFVDLINGKRDSLNHMYQQTFHTDAPTIDKQANEGVTAKVHQRLNGGPTAQPNAPVKVSSPADAAKLPRGTHFIDPNGVERVVP